MFFDVLIKKVFLVLNAGHRGVPGSLPFMFHVGSASAKTASGVSVVSADTEALSDLGAVD